MARQRFRFGLRGLLAGIACLAIVFAGIRASQQWAPVCAYTYRVAVVRSNGSVRSVSVNDPVYEVIGRRITTDRLVEIIELRNAQAKGKPRSSEKPSLPSETRVTAAAFLLGEVRDPRALNPLVKLLDDPLVENRLAAAKALGELGDFRAIPYLRAQLTDDLVKAEAAYALALLDDLDSGVQAMIESMDGYNAAWMRLRTIEELTGLTAEEVHKEWDDDNKRSMRFDEFKQATLKWWEEHKAESPYRRPGG